MPGMEFWNWDIPYTDLNNIESLVAKVWYYDMGRSQTT
jgi:hypothetical protein